ncbi:uncharacterized protein [Nicotiana tomentosiformis]|uniref:uncharacterized protein n=1 Tax=Nicotiana tomentosiformis TaxID=4098 RepID=UPI00388CD623
MTDEEQKRLERFKRLDSPEFSGGESEDAQSSMYRCHLICITSIVDISGVAFTTFLLIEAAYRWWRTYESGRTASAAPLTWHELSVLFLETFVPQTCREELRREFEQLRHEVWLVPTERENIRRLDGLNYGLCYSLAREAETDARFDWVVDIAKRLEQVRRLEHEKLETKRPHGSSGFSGASSRG